jgi:hypothetical protein
VVASDLVAVEIDRVVPASGNMFAGGRQILWVPRTSSTSLDQAVFADQATDASLPSDAVLLKIDRFGQRFQRCCGVQGTVRPVLIVVVRADNLVHVMPPGDIR